MELFVNFCEDTIFEMQLAAQISGSESGEELKAKDDNEEKDNVEMKENLVEDSRSIRNIRKHIKRITIRNIILAIFSFFQNTLLFITHAFLGLAWFCLYLLYHIFLSGWATTAEVPTRYHSSPLQIGKRCYNMQELTQNWTVDD